MESRRWGTHVFRGVDSGEGVSIVFKNSLFDNKCNGIFELCFLWKGKNIFNFFLLLYIHETFGGVFFDEFISHLNFRWGFIYS